MKKLLFVCAGVGLAIGGGYLMYQAWKKYCQGEGSEDQDNDTGDGQVVDVTDSSTSDCNAKKCESKNSGNKKKDNKNNFGGFKSGFLL